MMKNRYYIGQKVYWLDDSEMPSGIVVAMEKHGNCINYKIDADKKSYCILTEKNENQLFNIMECHEHLIYTNSPLYPSGLKESSS